jgi:hypothetical protein
LSDARFVVMARDPRATAVSMMRVGERLAKAGMPNTYPRDMERLGRRIEQAYAFLFGSPRRIWGRRLAWIQYERLVADPLRVARKLTDFTGLDLSGYDPRAAWPGWNDGRVATEKVGGNYASDLWGKPVTAERVETWRDVLTEQEAQTILTMCPNITGMFGYGKQNEATGKQS